MIKICPPDYKAVVLFYKNSVRFGHDCGGHSQQFFVVLCVAKLQWVVRQQETPLRMASKLAAELLKRF